MSCSQENLRQPSTQLHSVRSRRCVTAACLDNALLRLAHPRQRYFILISVDMCGMKAIAPRRTGAFARSMEDSVRSTALAPSPAKIGACAPQRCKM